MTRRMVLRPEAAEEIRDAASWYVERGSHLEADFLTEVAARLDAAREAPERFPVVEGEMRKAVLRRFPYIILFRARPEEVVIVSCFHTRRDPKDRPGVDSKEGPAS